MTLTWPNKDPDAVLDYEIDWSAWLGTDTIASSTWIIPAGMVKNSDTHDDTTATVWLSGGTDGATYLLTNRITTTGSRTNDRSVAITVRQQ